jgi:hypothetical protein
MKKIFFCVICILSFGASPNLLAQSQTMLHGKVTVAGTTETIPKVYIEVRRNGITVLKAQSGEDGYYYIHLDAGTYTLLFNKMSWETAVVENVVLNSGRYSKLNLALSPNSNFICGSPVYQYKQPLVEEDNTTNSTIYTGEQLRGNALWRGF